MLFVSLVPAACRRARHSAEMHPRHAIPGNAGAWRMVGTLLGDSDADFPWMRTAYPRRISSCRATRAYLMVSPVGSRPVRGAYQGCYVFQFSRSGFGKAGTRQRQAEKSPGKIHGTPGSFNGACTYAQNVTAAGFLYGEIKISNPRRLSDLQNPASGCSPSGCCFAGPPQRPPRTPPGIFVLSRACRINLNTQGRWQIIRASPYGLTMVSGIAQVMRVWYG